MTGFAQLLADLNRAVVRYVVVGGIAVIRYGVVRATKDVDVVVSLDEPTHEAVTGLIREWKATRPNGVPVPICSLADLVALKRIAGRPLDLEDLNRLETAHGSLPDPPR